MARALLRLGKVNLSESELRRMLRGSHRLSDRTKRMALILLSNVHREQGDRFLAIVDGEKCLAMARESGDAEIASAAHHAVGSAWYEEGDYARALDSLLQAREGHRSLGHAEKSLTLLADIGVCEVAIGKPRRGLQRIREAVHGARLGNHRRALGYGLAKEGLAHVLLKEAPAARSRFQEAEVVAGGGEDRYLDILFLCAYYQWKIAREDRNPVQEKITFGRLKHLRPSLERRFLEVQWFDEFIQGAEEARTP